MRPIDYTDKAILRMLVDHALQMNGWLRLGDALTGPTGLVRDGKIVDSRIVHQDPPPNAISLKTMPPNLTVPTLAEARAVTAGSVSLSLADIVSGRIAGLAPLDLQLSRPTYLHPYVVHVPNREWLENFSVGDTVAVGVTCPNTFSVMYVNTQLTQQMIDENSTVIFRFSLSPA